MTLSTATSNLQQQGLDQSLLVSAPEKDLPRCDPEKCLFSRNDGSIYYAVKLNYLRSSRLHLVFFSVFFFLGIV